MCRPFSFECSSVWYKPHSAAVKIITPHCFCDVPPFHTQCLTRKLKNSRYKEINAVQYVRVYFVCLGMCAFPHNWIDKISEDRCWGYDILTCCSQLTRRLSVWGEAMLFQIWPSFWLSVCSGGHCPPQWTNIIQASGALWWHWHSPNSHSEWNAGNKALKLTIGWENWEHILSSPFYPYFASFWKWH